MHTCYGACAAAEQLLRAGGGALPFTYLPCRYTRTALRSRCCHSPSSCNSGTQRRIRHHHRRRTFTTWDVNAYLMARYGAYRAAL
jgi:hypothetical protein